MKLKEMRYSQSRPFCLNAPHLMRLGILKDQPQLYEEQCESFRQQLANLKMPTQDRNFIKLINNMNGAKLGLG